MKILTWNINGIRASKVPLKQVFDSLDADIICLQETKVTRDMLDERSAIVDGYNSYYSFSNARTGYSGVATYVREAATPVKAEQGLTGYLSTDEESAIGHYGDHSDFTEEELELLDKEGRTIITQHNILDCSGKQGLLTVLNVYCPRADPEREDRKTFKLRFYQLLQIRAEAILKSGSHVIILGDVNTSHRRIDHCDPDDTSEFEKSPGRMWLDQLLWFPEQPTLPTAENKEPESEKTTTKANSKKDHGPKRRTPDTLPDANPTGLVARTVSCLGGHFVDTFRYFHPTQTHAFTCWNTMVGARETNYGTRIDYILANKDLATAEFTDCEILPDVIGSDHCPVKGYMKCTVTAAKKCPPLCTKYFPEFMGVQTKLSAFFTKGVKRQMSEETKNAGSAQSLLPEEKSEATTTEANAGQSLTKSSSFPPPSKKTKLEKSATAKKQSSLAIFFNAKGSIDQPNKKSDKNEQNQNSSENCFQREMSAIEKSQTGDNSSGTDWKLTGIRQPNSSSAWKNLLKGPPPAPLCKGHKEPCLLRTVKKEDSLNKGRQFYVCCRPEGHKSNPEARCDHFEWIEKKKKK